MVQMGGACCEKNRKGVEKVLLEISMLKIDERRLNSTWTARLGPSDEEVGIQKS